MTESWPYEWRWALGRRRATAGLAPAAFGRWWWDIGGERKGDRCRVLARARHNRSGWSARTALVEFMDGFRMVAPVRGLRRRQREDR